MICINIFMCSLSRKKFDFDYGSAILVLMKPEIIKKLTAFFSSYKPIQYKKNDFILRSDDEDLIYIYYLESGFVKMFINADGGEEIILNIFKPFAFFPVIVAMNNAQNRYNFGAITDVVVRRAPKESVLNFLNKNPDVLYDLTARLGKGIAGLLLSYEQLIAQSAYNRILMNLITMSKRFGKDKDTNSTIKLSLTHQDIANSVGLSRETVSRELKKMVKNKVIERNGKFITLHNVHKLELDLFY